MDERGIAKNIWQISAYTMRSLAREEASGAVPGGERRQKVASLGAVIAQGVFRQLVTPITSNQAAGIV